jgi:rhodanese-related sulfurtransferase
MNASPSPPTAPDIDAATLRTWLGDRQEIALVDVRDGGPFARSHLLVASNLPLARLEVMAPALLPRRSVRAVLMDEDGALEGPARHAAQLLHSLVAAAGSQVGVAAGSTKPFALSLSKCPRVFQRPQTAPTHP